MQIPLSMLILLRSELLWTSYAARAFAQAGGNREDVQMPNAKRRRT
jgi:hypothetical protein